MRQNSGIDELNDLLNEKQHEKKTVIIVNSDILEKQNESSSELQIVNQEHGRNLLAEEIIDTSLNFRMSQLVTNK